ncbi:hypothetical protein [Leptospira weilii]|nr:hypothetical protein [Leptospira weilii]
MATRTYLRDSRNVGILDLSYEKLAGLPKEIGQLQKRKYWIYYSDV